MITVILVIHILVSVVLIAVVLMQRSEGGALGIGGGGGGGAGGMMSGRGVAGALVRTTMIFGGIFFITSIGLTTLAISRNAGGQTQIEQNLNEEFNTPIVEPEFDDILGSSAVDIVDPLAVDPAPAEEAPPADPLAPQP
ncbi:MAG: preprotein translocase subunit SecG [Pseudomonadota bacterium]